MIKTHICFGLYMRFKREAKALQDEVNNLSKSLLAFPDILVENIKEAVKIMSNFGGQMKFKKGDLALYYPNTFMSRVVAWWTKGKYCHCELVIEDDGTTMNICDKGVIKGKIYNVMVGRDYDIYRPDYSSKLEIKRAVRYANELIEKNTKYGFLNLMAFVFIKLLRRFKIKWFEGNGYVTCSEGSADCLVNAPLFKLTDIPNSLLSPNDLIYAFTMDKINGVV